MPTGSYDIRVSADRFREFVREAVPVGPNAISRVDVTLAGLITEKITGRSEPALLQTGTADVHTEISSREIVNLPLAQYRNYQSLINLVPGASPATFQNSEVDTPGRSLRTFFNGQNPNNNATRIDGVTNINIGLPRHAIYVSPAEMIDTVTSAPVISTPSRATPEVRL